MITYKSQVIMAAISGYTHTESREGYTQPITAFFNDYVLFSFYRFVR